MFPGVMTSVVQRKRPGFRLRWRYSVAVLVINIRGVFSEAFSPVAIFVASSARWLPFSAVWFQAMACLKTFSLSSYGSEMHHEALRRVNDKENRSFS